MEKMSGRILNNMPLISADRAAGALAFIRRPACPPPFAFPRHMSGDEIEMNISRARVVCCSPEGEIQL